MAKGNEHRDWKLPNFGDLCPSRIDWARMAAYIDGEGSILINPRSSKQRRADDLVGASTFYLKVTVANTDVRLLEWIKVRFGGSWKEANTQKYYEGKNAKNAYHWSASSGQAAWVLHNCFEFFVIKQEQAVLGIQLQESMNKYSRVGRTRVLPDEAIAERREIKKKLLTMKARGKVIQPAQAERIAALA